MCEWSNNVRVGKGECKQKLPLSEEIGKIIPPVFGQNYLRKHDFAKTSKTKKGIIIVPEGNILIRQTAACSGPDFAFRGCRQIPNREVLCNSYLQKVSKGCLRTLLTSPSNLRGCVCTRFFCFGDIVCAQTI